MMLYLCIEDNLTTDDELCTDQRLANHSVVDDKACCAHYFATYTRPTMNHLQIAKSDTTPHNILQDPEFSVRRQSPHGMEGHPVMHVEQMTWSDVYAISNLQCYPSHEAQFQMSTRDGHHAADDKILEWTPHLAGTSVRALSVICHDKVDSAEDDTSTRNTSEPSQQGNKSSVLRPHYIVEKSYREGLNAKLWELHEVLNQTMRFTGTETGGVHKMSKTKVLSNAICYVNEMEVELRHMRNELAEIRRRLKVETG